MNDRKPLTIPYCGLYIHSHTIAIATVAVTCGRKNAAR